MRYFKFALAAGASIVVAARLSPAYALPPVYPLDANGPIRQGNMCIAPSHAHWAEISTDTGPGYSYFYECGRHKRAHRETHTAHAYTGAAPWAPREDRPCCAFSSTTESDPERPSAAPGFCNALTPSRNTGFMECRAGTASVTPA
jgi:hypothetical protein